LRLRYESLRGCTLVLEQHKSALETACLQMLSAIGSKRRRRANFHKRQAGVKLARLCSKEDRWNKWYFWLRIVVPQKEYMEGQRLLDQLLRHFAEHAELLQGLLSGQDPCDLLPRFQNVLRRELFLA
jgi:hypothetical protein